MISRSPTVVNVTVSSLLSEGRSLRKRCNVLFDVIPDSEVVESLSRWALAEKVGRSSFSPRFRKGSFAIAVHVPPVGLLSQPDSSWASGVVVQLSNLAKNDWQSGGAVPISFYSFGGRNSSSIRLPSGNVTIVDLPDPETLLNLAVSDAIVCAGSDPLCIQAAISSRTAFSVISDRNPVCPSGVECVGPGPFPKDVSFRFLDSLDRWRIRRHLGCPPLWQR